MAEANEAMKAMARRIVKTHYPEMRADYRGRRYQIALAAIIETQEACAKVADKYEAQENDRAWDKRQAGRDDNFNCARASAAVNIAAGIRAGAHYAKDENNG